MKKSISLIAIIFILTLSIAPDVLAYRTWFDRIVNGKVVDSECYGSDGNCLPEVVVNV